MKDLPELDPRHVFWVGLLVECSLIGVAAGLGVLTLGEPFPFELRLDAASFLAALAATVPIALYMAFSFSPAGRRLGSLRRIYEFLRTFFGRPLIRMRAWQLVALGLAAGAGEETLFRGVLQPWVRELTAPWPAVILTSIAFGMLHAVTPAYFIVATVLSCYFGWLMLEVENLLVPVLAHGLYDAFGFVLLQRSFRKDAAALGGSDGGEENSAWPGEEEHDRSEPPAP